MMPSDKEKAAFIADLRRRFKPLSDAKYLEFLHKLTPGLGEAFGIRSNDFAKEATRFLELHSARLAVREAALRYADECWKEGLLEARWIALRIVRGRISALKESDWKIVSEWRNHATEWIATDSLSDVLGALLLRFPRRFAELKRWAKDSNPWIRRIAVVTTIAGVHGGDKETERVYEIAALLADDKDPNVQKGAAWALREAGKKDSKALVGFIKKHGGRMSRLALREATAKLPREIRDELVKPTQRARRRT